MKFKNTHGISIAVIVILLVGLIVMPVFAGDGDAGWVTTFFKTLLANFDFASLSLGSVIGAIILALYASFMPNEIVYNHFRKIGRKVSGAGRKALKIQFWEGIENKLTGTIVSAAKGLQDGADEDDAEE